MPELLSKIARYIISAAVVISVIIGRILLQKTMLSVLIKRTKNKTMYTIARIAADRILMTKNRVGNADSK